MKKISVVIPSYNEEKNIPLVYDKIKSVFLSIPSYEYEMVFVDDGSKDKSVAVLEEILKSDAGVKLIEFSRNFGKEAATSAGLEAATGDAVMLIDADLQHPAELIPSFIKKWEEGMDVVVGVREKNKGEGLVKKLGSIFFYKIMNAIGETKITPRATDFRLIDRNVVDEFNNLTEKSRMTRGLIDWLGFRRDYIYFTANERINGTPAYNKIKLIKLALSSFVAHSLFPLRVVGYLGVAITVCFGLLGTYLFIGKYFLATDFANSFTGPALLAILLAFFIGIILSSLGLIAMYIENIHKEVVNRPAFVVRKRKQ
jgi:polyisoprenyl-phosphate glycosyltransferase